MLIYEAIDYFFITIFASGFGQENCKLQIKKDSITIYTCTIKNSKYKAVKTEGRSACHYKQPRFCNSLND